MNISRRAVARTLAAGSAAALLAACGSSTPAADNSSTSSKPTTTSTASSSALTAKDFWVKAVEGGMTGAFGEIKNNTDAPINIVSGTSPVAGMVELHEVVTSGSGTKMQPKAGGFVVPAKGTYTLKPGGDHVMLMQLKGALKPGDQVEFTLKTATGDTLKITGVVKTFAGAQETYVPKTSG